MELELFRFVEDVMECYDRHYASYETAEKNLRAFFEGIGSYDEGTVIAIHSRIKTKDSIREKLLRNKYYLNYADPEDALHAMPDVVGIAIECRFIRNEAELYRSVTEHFFPSKTGMSKCMEQSDIFLNLRMVQPQLMRNGYAMYRIDGMYQEGEEQVSFELQIKSLVHRFWSEIEHEIVYKNKELYSNDRFIKNMLGSVRDSMDVVDRQMEIICNEIEEKNSNVSIGMDENGFKLLAATSINELVIQKMSESVGFTLDFRKAAATLSQYIYVRFFINGSNNEVKMVEFLEHLNYLAKNEIDYRSKLVLEREVDAEPIFAKKLLAYCKVRMNEDFEWHSLFTTLFAIQEGENAENLEEFVTVMHRLVIQPGWYQSKFALLNEHQHEVQELLQEAFVDGMIDANHISVVYEENMLKAMYLFRDEVEHLDLVYNSYDEMKDDLQHIVSSLRYRISRVFHS